MKFYRPRSMDPVRTPAVLWDSRREAPVYQFVQGECEIPDVDTQLIARMKAMGFMFVDPKTGTLTTQADMVADAAVAAMTQELGAEQDPQPAPQPEPEIPEDKPITVTRRSPKKAK